MNDTKMAKICDKLSGAIVFGNASVIDNILLSNSGNIFTHQDVTGFSPISHMLYSGDSILLSKIKNYIDKNQNSIIKVQCTTGDLANIRCIMRFPQMEELASKKAYVDLLGPLYTNMEEFDSIFDSFGWDSSNSDADDS